MDQGQGLERKTEPEDMSEDSPHRTVVILEDEDLVLWPRATWNVVWVTVQNRNPQSTFVVE